MLGEGEAGIEVAVGTVVGSCGAVVFVAGEFVLLSAGGGVAVTTNTTFSVCPWQLAKIVMNMAHRINRKRIGSLHNLLWQPSN